MRILAQWNSRIEQFLTIFNSGLDGVVSYEIPSGAEAFAQEDGIYWAWALIKDDTQMFFLKIRFSAETLRKTVFTIPAEKDLIQNTIHALGQRIEKPCALDKPIVKILQSEKETFEQILRKYFPQ